MKATIKNIPLSKLHSEALNKVCLTKCGACRFKNWFYMKADIPNSIRDHTYFKLADIRLPNDPPSP